METRDAIRHYENKIDLEAPPFRLRENTNILNLLLWISGGVKTYVLISRGITRAITTILWLLTIVLLWAYYAHENTVVETHTYTFEGANLILPHVIVQGVFSISPLLFIYQHIEVEH